VIKKQTQKIIVNAQSKTLMRAKEEKLLVE